MGSRGPLPDRRLAVLKGDGRVRDFSRAVTAAPDKPDHLGEVAAKVWDDVGPELERLGLLSRLDGVMLETFCRTYELWLAHDGGRGCPALTSVLGKLARDLGLAPGVRQRMERPAPDPAEEAAIFGLL